MRNSVDTGYDLYKDDRSVNEYVEWSKSIFNEYGKVLKKDGVVLYNLSYGVENPTQLMETVYGIISGTNFTIADIIVWKKKSAFPNNVSHNKLTRIWEFVFVLCRKDEFKTFNANKKVSSVSRTGQKYYENIFNFIDAKNNDGANSLNKATFSTDLVDQLFEIYLQPNSTVLDNFSGTGTTLASVSKVDGCKFIGVELSEPQCDFTAERLKEYNVELLTIEKEHKENE